MHPEHTRALRDTVPPSEPLPTSPFPSAQYGNPNPPAELPSLPQPAQEVCAGARSRAGDGRESHDHEEDNPGMNNDTGVKISPEGEGDLLPPSGKKGGLINRYEAMGLIASQIPGFHVKNTDWRGRKDSPISRFPNEILIHVLSFLDPQTLLTASFISRRFHSLMTSSHPWQSAFSRFFPLAPRNRLSSNFRESTALSTSRSRHYFTRLSASGDGGNAWRREYILRTWLLRNLAKARANLYRGSQGSIVITYYAQMEVLNITHITASFSPWVRLLHSSVDTAVVTASEPMIGEVEKPRFSSRMHELNITSPILGAPRFGVATDMGVTGVMDLSEDVGWVYGENVNNGRCYVHPYSSPYRSSVQGGFFIHPDRTTSGLDPAITAVWIAKQRWGGVLETTGGQVGVMVGNSRGIVEFFRLGLGEHNLTRTKSFCVCPGVPVVSIKVDENYSVKRKRRNLFWVVVVNSLGEVYHLVNPKDGWNMIPQTVRRASPLYDSVFPPSKGDVVGAEADKNERNEVLLNMDYHRLKELWEGWGMNWFIEVDWAGRNIAVGKKGAVGIASLGLVRYHLVSRVPESGTEGFIREVIVSPPEGTSPGTVGESVFGGESPTAINWGKAGQGGDFMQSSRQDEISEEWVTTTFEFWERDIATITAIAIDNSNLAMFSPSEDPGLTPDVPGGNARLFAVGTSMGSVFVWNIRHPVSSSPAGDEDRAPLSLPLQRVIRTESPQISTLALSSLCLVHGGTDGRVQVWDPLASTYLPIRTIHPKLPEHTDPVNRFAPSCLVLDPNPTRLRGAVALGRRIRYWCFSSSSGPGISKKSRKPQAGFGPRNTPTKVGADIRDTIVSQSDDLVQERDQERKEREELEKRYGVSSGREALSEEEMLEYARMISLEAYKIETISGGSAASEDSNKFATPEGSGCAPSSHGTTDEFRDVPEEVEDLELAEALRLSLEESINNTESRGHDSGDIEVFEDAQEYLKYEPYQPPITVAGPSRRNPTTFYTAPSNRSPSIGAFTTITPEWEGNEWPSVGGGTVDKGKGKALLTAPRTDREELELAIQLSLREDQERREIMEALDEGEWGYMPGKGKGRA